MINLKSMINKYKQKENKKINKKAKKIFNKLYKKIVKDKGEVWGESYYVEYIGTYYNYTLEQLKDTPAYKSFEDKINKIEGVKGFLLDINLNLRGCCYKIALLLCTYKVNKAERIFAAPPTKPSDDY